MDRTDEVSGRVYFKAGVSLMSWGENIPVQVIRVSDCLTRMEVLSTPKTGVMMGGMQDFGKNRRNIEKIIKAVSDVLATKPKEVPATQQVSVVSKADELLKLKQLLDAGALTQDEFDSEKKRILNPTCSISNNRVSENSTSVDNFVIEEVEPTNTMNNSCDSATATITPPSPKLTILPDDALSSKSSGQSDKTFEMAILVILAIVALIVLLVLV